MTCAKTSLAQKCIGLKENTGRRIKMRNFQKRRRMELWVVRARAKLLEARRRYKEKVSGNKRRMAERKTGAEKNNNPTFFPIKATIARKPYLEVSLVPAKPRYSNSPPKPRLYGIKLELLDAGKLYPSTGKLVCAVKGGRKNDS